MAAKQHTPSPYLAAVLADVVGGNEEATACAGLLRQDGGRHGRLLPTSLFERPAAELYVDDSAQLGDDRRQPDHIA